MAKSWRQAYDYWQDQPDNIFFKLYLFPVSQMIKKILIHINYMFALRTFFWFYMSRASRARLYLFLVNEMIKGILIYKLYV